MSKPTDECPFYDPDVCHGEVTLYDESYSDGELVEFWACEYHRDEMESREKP